jgi:hypothetical protein
MAILSDSDRAELNRIFMRDCREVFAGVLQADLRAAVNGLDDYFDTNANAINQAIPQPARSALTTTQKALLVRYIIAKRYG